jgi:ribosomal subunit interface protein
VREKIGKGETMNVIVQSKTLVVTDAIRDFVTRQAKKISRKGQKISQIHVFLDLIARKKNDAHSATVRFLVDLPGKNIVVQERAQDLYLAIGEAAKRTMRQLNKKKIKKMNRLGRLAVI